MNVELSCKQPTSAMSEAWMHVQVDNRQQQDLLVTATQAVDLCDRHFGIGADGVRLELQPVEGILMAYGIGWDKATWSFWMLHQSTWTIFLVQQLASHPE